MLAALGFWLSPARRRFMRNLARPGLDEFRRRLKESGSTRAIEFITPLVDANANFLAYAMSKDGPLARWSSNATPERVAACINSLMIFSINLFARDEMQKSDSELIPLVAFVAGIEPKQLLLRRDMLRKAPRSEEWMLLTWLARDLGVEQPKYDAELERSFGYNYLSYVDQYRPTLARALARADEAESQ
jgi:hypothetical protein